MFFLCSVSTAGPQRPDRMPKDMPDRTPDSMSDRMPEDMPDKMPEDMPDRMPEGMPDRMSDRMPEGMPDKVPECLPEHMPEDLPDKMPDRMSEDMPEDMPDRVPEDMPEHIAEDMPGRMPEDLPDRMPEDMPYKMPEDMSDRMPEDLPVTKRIDVMVGKTRSKVFFSMWKCMRICNLEFSLLAKIHNYHWKLPELKQWCITPDESWSLPRNVKKGWRPKVDIQSQKFEGEVNHQEENGGAIPAKVPQTMIQFNCMTTIVGC